MISKVFILISFGIYIVLASWNVSQKDSHFLIERLFKLSFLVKRLIEFIFKGGCNYELL